MFYDLWIFEIPLWESNYLKARMHYTNVRCIIPEHPSWCVPVFHNCAEFRHTALSSTFSLPHCCDQKMEVAVLGEVMPRIVFSKLSTVVPCKTCILRWHIILAFKCLCTHARAFTRTQLKQKCAKQYSPSLMWYTVVFFNLF